jgi:hypothetical protein
MKPNKKLWVAVGFSIIIQIFVFMTPLGDALHVVPVAAKDAVWAVVIPVAAVLIAVDLHKLLWRALSRRHG